MKPCGMIRLSTLLARCQVNPPVTGGFPSQRVRDASSLQVLDSTHSGPEPCLTTATWRCRKNFSQWECSFHWKLRCHWLEFLRQRQIAVVRQGSVIHSFDSFIIVCCWPAFVIWKITMMTTTTLIIHHYFNPSITEESCHLSSGIVKSTDW